MIDFESELKPKKIDLKKEINEEMQSIIEKIDGLHLLKEDEERIKQELKAFVEVDGNDVLEKIRQISREMDMIMNYRVMVQAAVHDKNTHISMQEVIGKARKSLNNIYAILRRENVQEVDGAISVYKTSEEPIQ